jgi:UMF1 family MFS transporter
LLIIIHEKSHHERTNSSMIQPRQKWGWAMYDWANSAFATVVMAGFFPVFFKDYWNAGLDPVDSTFRLGMANSLASLLIVLLAPLLGAVADRLARRKALLLSFALLGSLMTAGLYLVGQGEWQNGSWQCSSMCSP